MNNIIEEIKIAKENCVKEAGRDVDVPPIVFIEKGGKLLAFIVAPEVDKVKGLNIVALSKIGFDPDYITLAFDAKIYCSNKIEQFEQSSDEDKIKFQEEIMTKFPKGLSDPSISEEDKKLIKDCLFSCRVDKNGEIEIDMVVYEYKNGNLSWVESDKNMDMFKKLEGFIPDSMKGIMTQADFLTKIVPALKGVQEKIHSGSEKDQFIAARAIMSVCVSQGCKVSDYYSKEHPEWIDFEGRTKDFLEKFVSKFFPKEALDCFSKVVKDFPVDAIESEICKILRKNPYWSPQNLRNEESYVQFAKIFKEVCCDPSVTDVSAMAAALGEKGFKRVRVWNGDQSEYYGEGTINGEVEVYFCKMPDGEILSESNPEVPMKNIPEGGKLVKLMNPKIILDDGKVVYGCQTWWEEI
ncbi:MAG: hypothetical protein WCG45_03785 [bacterium]